MANHSIAKSALATFFTLATSSYAFANSAIGSLSDRPERAKRTGSAALISDQGHILSSSALVGRADSMFFAFKGGGVPVEATVVAVDDAIGVALLKLETIPANGVSPIIFSKNGATVGRLVTAQELINGALSQTEGAVSNALVRENGASRFLKHNALISAAGYGGILENECGEGVGINVVDPFLSTRRARQLPEPEGGIYAADLDGVLGFVRTRSVEIAVANDICLSAEERNKKLEEQREEDRSNFRKKESEKQAEIDRVEQELVEKERKSQQAQERADEAQREAERRAAEVERLKRDRKASAKERQAAEEDLEAARKDAEQAAIDAAERAEEIKTLESEQAALQEAMDASDKRQKIILIGAGVGFVLLSLLAGLLIGRRTRALNSERSEKQTALEKLNATFPNIECRGQDQNNVPHAFMVSGNSLLKSSAGLVIGRQPQSSDILLNHPEISRAHLRATLRDGTVYVQDLGSTNGSTLNGAPLPPNVERPLNSGDILGLGKITLQVRFLNG